MVGQGAGCREQLGLGTHCAPRPPPVPHRPGRCRDCGQGSGFPGPGLQGEGAVSARAAPPGPSPGPSPSHPALAKLFPTLRFQLLSPPLHPSTQRRKCPCHPAQAPGASAPSPGPDCRGRGHHASPWKRRALAHRPRPPALHRDLFGALPSSLLPKAL